MNELKLLFIQAIKQNNIDLVKSLIENDNIDPLLNQGFAFRFSCENGFNDIFFYISKLPIYSNFKIDKKTFTEVIGSNNYKIIKYLIKNKFLLEECYNWELIKRSWNLFNELEVTFLLFELPKANQELKANDSEVYNQINKKYIKYKIKEF